MAGPVSWRRAGEIVADGASIRFEAARPERWQALYRAPGASGPSGVEVGVVVAEERVWRATSFPPRLGRRPRIDPEAAESTHLARGSAFLAVEQRVCAVLAAAA